MRLAVFSDVHGNLSTLEAVLDDIAGEPVDEIVFVGDLCLVGPRPAECLDRVRDLGCAAVYGNTDDWLLGRQQAPEHLAGLAEWTNAQLDASQRSWLEDIPFAYTVSAGEGSVDSLLIVHANPQDVNQLIFPPEDEQMARYGRIRQADSALDDLLSGVESSNVVFGHLHIPFIRARGQTRLFNISSLSMPGDGDPRAKYALFTWEGDRWSFERKYVSYNMAPEIAAYRANKPPGWQKFIDAINEHGFVPQKV